MTRNDGIAHEFRNRIKISSGEPEAETGVTALSAEEFQHAMGVSAQTLERLQAHLDLLARWQPKINLVGAATLGDPWRRHILDSAQLSALLPAATKTVIDIGSGAGFPGLVLAIMAADTGVAPALPQVHVHLIESDQRKCIFLNEIIRLTGVFATVHQCRAETYSGPAGDVVTARACAPLSRLLGWAAPVMAAGGTGLFAKGENAQDELTFAAKGWKMQVIQHASRADPRGVILEVSNLARRDDS